MTLNVGTVDRIVRLVLAISIAVFYFLGYIEGVLGTILVVVGIAFFVTGLIRFCPLYTPFKISTLRKKKA